MKPGEVEHAKAQARQCLETTISAAQVQFDESQLTMERAEIRLTAMVVRMNGSAKVNGVNGHKKG